MVLLSQLRKLSIRALYFTKTQRLSLSMVELDVLQDGYGEPASHVEKCDCPPGYAGDSCQVGHFPIHGVPEATCVACPTPCETMWPLVHHAGFYWTSASISPRLPSGIKYEKASPVT